MALCSEAGSPWRNGFRLCFNLLLLSFLLFLIYFFSVQTAFKGWLCFNLLLLLSFLPFFFFLVCKQLSRGVVDIVHTLSKLFACYWIYQLIRNSISFQSIEIQCSPFVDAISFRLVKNCKRQFKRFGSWSIQFSKCNFVTSLHRCQSPASI